METTSNQIVNMLLQSRRAQVEWRDWSVRKRLECIKLLRTTLVAETDKWIDVFARETFKTPTDTLTSECLLLASACSFYEKHATRMLRPLKVKTPIEFFGQKSLVRREPLGVVAVISPWNFPLQLSLIPVISALVAGNGVILKPSEHTPLINQEIENLLKRCGFPEDLVQVAHGGGAVGQALIEARPDKVFFTGGETVGQKVYQKAAQFMIPCDLELGGNGAMIICQDANVERAARAAVWGAFMHSGQVCVSVQRVYVERQIYEAFVERVVELTSQLRQGAGVEDDIGGMTTQAGFDNMKRLLDDAVAEGAKIRVGGYHEQVKAPFFPPTVVTGVHEQMSIVKEETFGPVLSIMPVSDEAEAIRRANDSPYGLNSYVFSKDMTKAQRIASALEVGNCYINDVIINIGNMSLPFGGVKRSGIGRYHGAEGLYTFCNTKSVMIDRGKGATKFAWFPYEAKRLNMFKKIMTWLYGR